SDEYIFKFFFFQAEDGIRDFHVTGVQTCALPIYRHEVTDDFRVRNRDRAAFCNLPRKQRNDGTIGTQHISKTRGNKLRGRWVLRSEERRVGKEWWYWRKTNNWPPIKAM